MSFQNERIPSWLRGLAPEADVSIVDGKLRLEFDVAGGEIRVRHNGEAWTHDLDEGPITMQLARVDAGKKRGPNFKLTLIFNNTHMVATPQPPRQISVCTHLRPKDVGLPRETDLVAGLPYGPTEQDDRKVPPAFALRLLAGLAAFDRSAIRLAAWRPEDAVAPNERGRDIAPLDAGIQPPAPTSVADKIFDAFKSLLIVALMMFGLILMLSTALVSPPGLTAPITGLVSFAGGYMLYRREKQQQELAKVGVSVLGELVSWEDDREFTYRFTDAFGESFHGTHTIDPVHFSEMPKAGERLWVHYLPAKPAMHKVLDGYTFYPALPGEEPAEENASES